MKRSIFGIVAAVLVALMLGGCSEAKRVEANQYGVIIDGNGNTDWQTIYNNENLELSNLCRKHCDRAHLFDRSTMVVTYPGKYLMPRSGDLELELDVELKIALRNDIENLPNLLRYVAVTYPVTKPDKRTAFTPLASIVRVELSDAAVKDFLRPILAQQTIESVMADVTGKNVTKAAALKAFNVALKDSPVRLLELNFKRIGWPASITAKKSELAGMNSQREIEIKQLHNDRLRETERQAFRIQQALNDLEIDGIYREVMSNKMLAWQWIDTANRFAESGTPFMLHPSMLGGMSLTDLDTDDDTQSADVEALRERFKQRLSVLAQEQESLRSGAAK